MGPPWDHVAPHWAIFGQSLKNLGDTLINLVLRKPCEVEIVDFTKVLQAFLKARGSRHLTRGCSRFRNVVISLVLEAFLNKGLGTMSFQSSKVMVFHWFYR